MDQAKFEGEKLPWHLKECCDDPNMDRHMRVLAPQLRQVFTPYTAQSSADSSAITTQLVWAERSA